MPFNMSPVGSGPYKFSQFIVKDGAITGVDLIANEDYYNGRPYIDEVVFNIILLNKPLGQLI